MGWLIFRVLRYVIKIYVGFTSRSSASLSPLYLFLMVTSVTPAASAIIFCVLFSSFMTQAM